MEVPSFAQISREGLDAEHSPTSAITLTCILIQHLPFLLRLLMYYFSHNTKTECLDLGLSIYRLQDVKCAQEEDCSRRRSRAKLQLTMPVVVFFKAHLVTHFTTPPP